MTIPLRLISNRENQIQIATSRPTNQIQKPLRSIVQSFSNDSELYDKEESDHGLSIGWLDLTLQSRENFLFDRKINSQKNQRFSSDSVLSLLLWDRQVRERHHC